jgi:hypothetical protein
MTDDGVKDTDLLIISTSSTSSKVHENIFIFCGKKCIERHVRLILTIYKARGREESRKICLDG